MPPRSSWKGFIKLSLVSVPVRGFTANATSREIHLNQLHEECHSRIKYQKVCPLHGEVQSSEIVSGYEYSKGQYVVVDPAELEKLRTENDRSINIDGFVDPELIDPMYFAGKSYYLAPDGAAGQKPYTLLVRAMQEQGRVAIAQTVLAGKEHVVLVRPLENLLVLNVLRYAEKVKSPASFQDEVVEPDITKDELKLTKTLLDATLMEDFDLTRYTDQYTAKLSTVIEAKVEGEEIVAVPDVEEPKIINLMEALKESVAKAQQSGPTRRKTVRKAAAKKAGRKMAPSARSRGATAKKKQSG